MKEEERRSLLRSLADDEYRDVMNVCARMPNVTMEVTSKGEQGHVSEFKDTKICEAGLQHAKHKSSVGFGVPLYQKEPF